MKVVSCEEERVNEILQDDDLVNSGESLWTPLCNLHSAVWS